MDHLKLTPFSDFLDRHFDKFLYSVFAIALMIPVMAFMGLWKEVLIVWMAIHIVGILIVIAICVEWAILEIKWYRESQKDK